MASVLAGWSTALGALIVAMLAAPRAQRPTMRRAIALLVLYAIALVLAGRSSVLAPWGGVVAAAAVLLTAQPLIALGALSRADIGLMPPRPGSLRAAVIVALGALALNAALIALRGTTPIAPMPTGLLVAMLAAPLEELVFRGVLLALADRALPPRWNVAGARIGWGGIAITVAFIGLHGLSIGMLAGIVPAALLYLWLRARTGSLAAPILAHLAWNLVVVLMH
jgi:membrane protease YdiL (CAAX protease family)